MKFLAPLIALAVGLIAAPTPAHADDEPAEEAVDASETADVDESRVRYQRVTEIEGDGLNLTGTIKGPDGSIVSLRRSAQFRPLVKLREHFNPEMAGSVNSIR